MQNLMVVFIFSDLDWKYSFGGKFGPENQNCQFKLKFGTKTNLNMQNSVVLFTFSFLTGNTFLGQILSLKQKFGT